PHDCHALRWPEEIFHQVPHALPEWSDGRPRPSNCVDQKMPCHRAECGVSRTESNDPTFVTDSDGLKKFSTRSPMLCRNGVTGVLARRTASIKKCAVIVIRVRRQPKGVELPHDCHALP